MSRLGDPSDRRSMTPQSESTHQFGTLSSATLERANSAGAIPAHMRSLSNGDTLEPGRKSPRRKPVPGLATGLAIANASLPASHPFASSVSNPSSTPTTPMSARFKNEDELFYVSPRPGQLPPPRSLRQMSPPLASNYGGMTYPRVDDLSDYAANEHGMYNGHPGQMYHSYSSSQGHGSSGHTREEYGEVYDREDVLSARERALMAKEQELQRREEFLRREEALRQREEELRAREEAFAVRERAASPINLPTSSSSSHPVFAVPPRNSSYLAPIHFDSQQRPLPPIPDPSRTDLHDSMESLPPITPADTPRRDSSHAHHGAAGLKQKLKINRKQISAPISAPIHKEHKTLNAKEKQPFSIDALPSAADILEARTLFLRDEQGELVCFGDLFPNPSGTTTIPGDIPPGSEKDELPPITKTVVFFIRHFWCGQCQDYTFASLSLLDPVTIRKAGIRVVVISNGSWKIIKAYRRLLKCPFPIYVDGPRKLYHLLGMTKLTNDFGPLFKGRAAYHQNSVPVQLVQSVRNAVKMPLANPGKFTQLGGEFIFSPGTKCDFAHRMSTTSDHMEAPEVLRRAGVVAPTVDEARGNEIKEAQQAELDKMKNELETWRRTREAELERIKRKKAERRGLPYDPSRNDSNFAIPDVDLEEEEIEQLNAAVERATIDDKAANMSGHVNGNVHNVANDIVLGPEIGAASAELTGYIKGEGLESEGLQQKSAPGTGNLHVTVDKVI